MPTLLVIGLGQGETKRYIAQALLDGGYDLVVLTGSVPGWIRELARRADSADLASADAVRHGIELGHDHAVDGVVTFDEAYVELAAAISGGLALPGLSPRAARLCRDKHAMRRQFSLAGIPSARSIMVRTMDQAMRSAAGIGYPVVLKPRNLAASIGVVRADSEDEIREFYAAASGATMSRVSALPGLLVEEYVEGQELSIESVIADGVTTACGVTEKSLGFAPFFEEVEHISRPLRRDDALDRQLVDLVRAVHEALDVTVGVTHCEIRLAPDGPRVIEIGARLAGDRIPEITRLASGIDLIMAAAAVATGREPDLRPTTARTAGVRMVYPPHSGLITRLAVKEAPSTLAGMGWYAAVGERIKLLPEGFLSRLAYLVAVGESRQDVVWRLDAGESALDIEVVP